jgi:hypothetical protein
VPLPPTDDGEEMMPKATMGQGPWVQIPDDMHRSPNTRFRLELGDRISALLTEVGVRPALMHDIMAYSTLLDIWREMSHDFPPSYAPYHRSYHPTSSEEGYQ